MYPISDRMNKNEFMWINNTTESETVLITNE